MMHTSSSWFFMFLYVNMFSIHVYITILYVQRQRLLLWAFLHSLPSYEICSTLHLHAHRCCLIHLQHTIYYIYLHIYNHIYVYIYLPPRSFFFGSIKTSTRVTVGLPRIPRQPCQLTYPCPYAWLGNLGSPGDNGETVLGFFGRGLRGSVFQVPQKKSPPNKLLVDQSVVLVRSPRKKNKKVVNELDCGTCNCFLLQGLYTTHQFSSAQGERNLSNHRFGFL